MIWGNCGIIDASGVSSEHPLVKSQIEADGHVGIHGNMARSRQRSPETRLKWFFTCFHRSSDRQHGSTLFQVQRLPERVTNRLRCLSRLSNQPHAMWQVRDLGIPEPGNSTVSFWHRHLDAYNNHRAAWTCSCTRTFPHCTRQMKVCASCKNPIGFGSLLFS